MKIKLSERWQNILIGLLGVIIVIIFTYSIVNIFLDNSKKEIKELKEIKDFAIKKEQIADRKRDAAIFKSTVLASKVGLLEGQLQENTKTLNRFQNSLDNSLIELNKVKKNESYYIPNVGTDEQYDFLSKYRYKEY